MLVLVSVIALLVLFSVILSLVGFVGMVTVLCLAQFAEWHEARRMQHCAITRPLAALSVSPEDDPDYVIVWDTQVPALELIAAGSSMGVPLSNLHACYRRLAHCYPELFEGSTFEQWLEFLEEKLLIVQNKCRVVLTLEGQDFLRRSHHCAL